MKTIDLYSLSKNYTSLTVWHGHRTFRYRVSTTVITPNKGMTRRERYDVLAAELYKVFGIPAPSYRQTKTEKRKAISAAVNGGE
jgi:hypothetical protein